MAPGKRTATQFSAPTGWSRRTRCWRPAPGPSWRGPIGTAQQARRGSCWYSWGWSRRCVDGWWPVDRPPGVEDAGGARYDPAAEECVAAGPSAVAACW